MELIKEEALEEGIKRGIEQGIDLRTEQMQKLFSILAEENRVDDIQKACKDSKYLEKLLKENDIKI